MSEEINEEIPAPEALVAVEDGFSLDNLQKHFQDCLQQDQTILLEKYILGTSLYTLQITHKYLLILKDN